MEQRDFAGLAPNVFTHTPEGYLTGRVCVTGAGVFRYMGDDGKFIGRLRPVDEVKAATASLNNKPVTLQHPADMVGTGNAKALSVGMTSNDAEFDGLNNFVTVTVTDAEAVKAIESGEVKAVSCGYVCEVDDSSGVWQGTRYDQRQSGITYNHVALVREGRAGDQVRFAVGDSADADILYTQKEEDMAEQTQAMVPQEQLDSVQAELDACKAELEQLKKEQASAVQDAVEIAEPAVETYTKDEAERLADERVKETMAAYDRAVSLGVQVGAADGVRSIRKAVIRKAWDAADLDDKDDSYLQGAWDMAVAMLSAMKPAPQSVIDAAPAGSPREVDHVERLRQKVWDISHGKEE